MGKVFIRAQPRASAISAVPGSAGKQPRLHPAGSPPEAPRAQRKSGAAATANHDRQGQRGKERPGVQRCPFRVFRVFRGSSCASLRLPLLVAALPLGASVVHCLVRKRRRLVSSDAPSLWLAKACFRKLNGGAPSPRAVGCWTPGSRQVHPLRAGTARAPPWGAVPLELRPAAGIGRTSY